MAPRRGGGRRPPPQQAAQAVYSDSEDEDDGIVALDQAPEHLKARPRPNTVIILSDSDSDNDVGQSAVRRPSSGTHKTPRRTSASRAMKRSYSTSSDESPTIKRTRFSTLPEAGPSTTPATPPVVERILPRADYLVPSVLEVIPDLCPAWAERQLDALIKELAETSNVPGQHAVQRTIEMAFEMERYPTSRVEQEPEEKGDYAEVTYRANNRRGHEYSSRAVDLLQDIFSTVPMPFIRETFATEGHKLLVPTYKILHKQSTSAEKPYQELKRKRNKGKQRAEEPALDPSSVDDDDEITRDRIAEYHKEHAFLQDLIRAAAQKELEQVTQQKADEAEQKRREEARAAAVECGEAVECGCCFDQEAPGESVACPEGHLFCKECLRALVESKLGDQQVVLKCMDMSGCAAEYTEVVIAAAVSAKTMSLYQRLRQMKELEMAAIDGLETCPFCPFAMVIDNEHEKLFRCQNEECKKITCRKCKRLDHIPKRCEEVEADLKLNSRHTVEEAMSEALVRKCPHCSKPYIKLDGCNKITCSACGKLSCFVCREAITNYDHFNGNHAVPAKRRDGSIKCLLYDVNEARTEADRIRSARDTAQRQVRANAEAQGVNVEERDLDIDVPDVPARARRAPAGPIAYIPREGPPIMWADLGGAAANLAPHMVRQGQGYRGALLPEHGVPHAGPRAGQARPAPDLNNPPAAYDAHEFRQILFNLGRLPHMGPLAHRVLGAPQGVAAPPDPRRRDARGRYVAGYVPPLPAPIARGNFEARLEDWRQELLENNRRRRGDLGPAVLPPIPPLPPLPPRPPPYPHGRQ